MQLISHPSVWQRNGQQRDSVLLILTAGKVHWGSSFDFSQTLCCRGHVCVQNARNITWKSVFFSGRRQPPLFSLVGWNDRVTSCAAAWQFLSSSEYMPRGWIQGTVTAVWLDNWFVSKFMQGFHLFFLHLGIPKPDRSNFKRLSQ